MKERPILFSGSMVRALLAGTKTQTRRVCKPAQLYSLSRVVEVPDPQERGQVYNGSHFGDEEGEVQFASPYGVPGDRLLCNNCKHDAEPHPKTDSRISERRLHGRVGRADLQPNEVRGVRPQDPCGLVSAQGACHEEGLRDYHYVARGQEGDESGSSPGLHGLPRHATDADCGDSALGRQRLEQCAEQPLLGNGGRELAGQAHARHGSGGREAPRSEVHGCGTGAHPLGHQQGVVQSAARGACFGCGAVINSGHRIGGDRLWVREAWRAPLAYELTPPRDIPAGTPIAYQADGSGSLPHFNVGKLRPSMFMPRWASRITLEITEVRVERLQDISDEDSLAEGIYPTSTGLYPGSPRAAYQKLWEQINGPGSWESNPWVWAVSFKQMEAS